MRKERWLTFCTNLCSVFGQCDNAFAPYLHICTLFAQYLHHEKMAIRWDILKKERGELPFFYQSSVVGWGLYLPLRVSSYTDSNEITTALCMSSLTCEQTFNVVEILACPNMVWTIFAGIPRSSRRVAKVPLIDCILMDAHVI